MKQTALLLAGLINNHIFRSICNFSVSLLFTIFLYIIQLFARNLIVDSVFLQISFTYTRNSSVPSTLPCGTPDVTLPPIITLRLNSLCMAQKEIPYPYNYPLVYSRGGNFCKQLITGNWIESLRKISYNSVYPTSVIQWVCSVLANRNYLTFTWISRPESMLTAQYLRIYSVE
jgi:hypothetical protein